MASLDRAAIVVETDRGRAQLARAGEGPPVLVAHGGPGGFDLGLAWTQHLRDGGCEVIALSRPGYLRTPLESGPSPQDQADLYAAVLSELDIERAAMVGFSSGGPSAVHFAARYPELTTALLLDAAILRPFEVPIGALRRAVYESKLMVWLSYQTATRRPTLATRIMVNGVSRDLNAQQRKAATRWITSDPVRLQNLQRQWRSIAPQQHRKQGWINDKNNERGLAPLPFAHISAPTLIAVGANDAIIPDEHAADAAKLIRGAELITVAEGHHVLSLSRAYDQVAGHQLELIHG